MEILCCLVLLVGASGARQPAPDEEARSIFYRSLEHAREGRIEKALEGYRHILDEHPADAFADDALMEQARIAEEVQGKPARALELYRRLLEEFPESRLVRRARSRSGFIEKHLDQGEEILARYQRILETDAGGSPAEAVAKMDELLKRAPGFSLRPDGLYWTGAVLARAGRTEEAIERWRRVARHHPDHPAAGRALMALGNLAMDTGDLAAAEEALEELSRLPGTNWKKAARESLARLERVRRLRWVLVAGFVVWLLTALGLWAGLAVGLVQGKIPARRLLRPPTEALVFLALMAALVIWAATGTRQTTRALLWMTGMIGLLILPNGWLLALRVPRGGKLLIWLFILAAASLGALVVAVGLAGMTGQVLHTLKWGPA